VADGISALVEGGMSPEPAVALVNSKPLREARDSVVLAYVVSNQVAYSWHRSMMGLVAFDAGLHGRLQKPGGYLAIKYGTGGLIEARNQAVHEFLEDYTADWLFWLDTDMGFQPNALELLLEAADPTERPIVGGLCFAQREDEPDGMGGWRTQPTPTIYDWITVGDQSGYAVRWDYPIDTVTQVHATGSACVLIHRSVLEKIRDAFTDGTIRPAWYDRLPNPTTQQLFSEDLSFCARAGALGFPVFVDTRVKTSHYKHQWVAEEDYFRQRYVQAAVDKPEGSPLPVHVDLEASLETLASNRHVKADGMLKLDEDLERYRQIIEATKPEVIVETGTRAGASARWFAEQGIDVITVDITPHERGTILGDGSRGQVDCLTGDSSDPDVGDYIRGMVRGRRCMVSLDADHSGPHVTKEIELYGPLVTPGCYLVVEDGIFGYATRTLRTAHGLGDMIGSPLDAIEKHLEGNPDWSRDIALERLSPTTHHPAGFWIRRE
jgi:cephalosporin hydroxylase